MKKLPDTKTSGLAWFLSPLLALPLAGQATTQDPATGTASDDIIVLSPFEVSSEAETGYAAATTLAGNRLNTDLRDVGNAIQVITTQFLQDTGAVNNETLLQYTTGTEVGNIYGNFTGLGDSAQLNETARFANPNQNTRVRGLTAADNTRDYFLSDIPWDGYNIDRVDLSRGPNSILFGQGSPAGIINAGTKPASFRDANEVEFRIGSHGSARATADFNKVIIPDELAIRVAGLWDHENFQQEPAFEDDERIFGALRWEPGFLKRGGARTILRMNYEQGQIDSNRPRTLPPNDNITPWFYTGDYSGRYTNQVPANLIPGTDPLGRTVANPGDPRPFQYLDRLTINPHLSANDNFYREDFPHGLIRPTINGGTYAGYPNPHFNPWIGSMGVNFGAPAAHYENAGVGEPYFIGHEIREVWGINTAGERDRGLGFDFHRMAGIANYSDYAINAGLPMAEFGIYKNRSLTDPSVFDFYNNLIDGPNKKEWQDFDVFNISLAQTFMNDKFGFDLTYNKENYERGQLSLITDWRQAIYVDINRVYTDGTHEGVNGVPFEDGTPNPNLGRPFITDNGAGGNNSYESDRESKRITGFFTHDFGEGTDNLLGRILGKHTLTGMWAEDEQNTDQRNWIRYNITDPDYRAFVDSNSKFNDGELFMPNQIIYLGDSLLNSSTASGANIPRVMGQTDIGGTVMARIFDTHWAAPAGVNPADPWINNLYPEGHDSRMSFQSENPANYVGWVEMPVTITDSEDSQANRDLLTTSARLERKKTTSKVFVWQAHLLENALVGTYGIRKDRAQGWIRSLNTDSGTNDDGVPGTLQYGHLNLAEAYYLPQEGSELEETSTSWSLMAHLDELPGISQYTERWPLSVSLFYSESENFQPEALRVDIYGEQLPLPRGLTRDTGILLESRDRRYSLRLNKFKTEVYSATSNALNRAAFIGTAQARGGNWANQFEYDFGEGNQPSNHHIGGQVNNRPAGAPNPPGWEPMFRPGNFDYNDTGRQSLWNYGADAGETPEETAAREAAAVAAWREWQNSVDPRFYEAWGIDLDAPFRQDNPTGLTATIPNGFQVTEDSVSEGYEIELSAEPVRNWRIAANVAKIEARRYNIGGEALANFIAAYENAILNTAAGDIRIWWGGAGNDTTLRQWYSGGEGLGGEWAGRKLQEGTNVPEMREWRVNVITNYDFTEGRLRGLNVGAGVRWQDEVVIGYRPVLDGNALSYDLSDPYMGPSETNYDFWVGYERKLSDRINWRIQLNVRNAFQDDELIPITVQPDGTPATYRIAPPQTWTISNTFRF